MADRGPSYITRRALLANLLTLTIAAGCAPIQRLASSTAATEPDGAAGPSAAGTPEPPAAALSEPSATPTPLLAEFPAVCPPPAVVVPTQAPNPGYAQLDASTGLHVTGTVQNVDAASFRLKVTGKVQNALSLSFDDLRCLPKVQSGPRLVCPGFFVDQANWAGARLSGIIAQAGPLADATRVEMKSADGYVTEVSLTEAQADDNFLAYEWEGQPLPILHGFPLRGVFPTQEGNKWVKWLLEIELI